MTSENTKTTERNRRQLVMRSMQFFEGDDRELRLLAAMRGVSKSDIVRGMIARGLEILKEERNFGLPIAGTNADLLGEFIEAGRLSSTRNPGESSMPSQPSGPTGSHGTASQPEREAPPSQTGAGDPSAASRKSLYLGYRITGSAGNMTSCIPTQH